jgi:hypothetical protein
LGFCYSKGEIAMAAQREQTIWLYRITEDGRRLLAGTIEAGEPAELVARWRAFLATATRGTYAACYRGETLGLEPADEAAYVALAA